MDEQLSRQFSAGNSVKFETGTHGLTFARIENQAARASVCLQGAHVTDYKPAGEEPVLWMSALSEFASGVAIRGGIPILWPWFGGREVQPPHGFVRTMDWQVIEAKAIDGYTTVLVFGVSDTAATRKTWPHAFDLRLQISVGAVLGVTLTVRNAGEAGMDSGGGFHPYFNVADSTAIYLQGLDGCEYLDKVENYKRKTQAGDLRLSGEVNQVYLSTLASVVVFDPHYRRRIVIDKSGSSTTVVWNPWKDASRLIGDFPDNGYENMICIEAVNAFDDVFHLAPYASHVISQQISVQPL